MAISGSNQIFLRIQASRNAAALQSWRLAAVSANINQAEWRLSVEIAMIINYFVSLIVIREVSNLFTMNQTDGIGAEQHPAAPEHCRDDFTHLEINLSFKARMILNISLQTPSPDSGLCLVSSSSSGNHSQHNPHFR